MATYVNDLRLKEITTGDESGTWGTSTNTNLELIAEAFSYGTEVITTNADTHTTTIADGASNPGRSLYLKYTGTLDSACTITIGPNTVSKVWIIENGTSGSQNIIISQGSGADITIPAGDTKVVYSDGAGAGAAFFDAFASLSVVDLKVQDDLTVTGDIDVDGTTNLDVVDIDGALTQDGGAVFNEASADVDFRVESDNDANALFVQGSDGNVGIGTASPTEKLSVLGGHVSVGDTTGVGGTEFLLEGYREVSGGTKYGNTSIRTTYDISSNASDMLFYTAVSGTNTDERMRIAGGGNVGIGIAIPVDALDITRPSGTASRIRLLQTGYESWQIGMPAADGAFTFAASGTERMRITSGGEVNINNTFTGAKLHVLATGSDTSNWCQRYYTTGTDSTLYVVDFIDYQGQRVGYITNNPVGNTTAYVTSSDYRLKENVDYTWDATTRLKQLKPARFNWIRDESNTLVDGFLAHEVEDIVPEAISGEKDATETKTNAVVNSYGNYIADNVTEEEWLAGKEDGTYDADTTWVASHTQDFYQGIDQAKLVPLLVKTIQELEARITTLENA
jgi:hypothetical protein